jgi:hypothetical protein
MEEKYNAKADVWSFVITLLEFSLGKRIYTLFKGIRPPAIIEDFSSESFLN